MMLSPVMHTLAAIRTVLRACGCAGAVLLFLCATPAVAAYPDRPIQVIISFPPAGATDVLTRAIGNQLSRELGQPVVVENRPGAGGAIGLTAAARAAPTGYVLYLAATSNQAIAAAIYRNQAAHLVEDFVPIGLIGSVPHALVVPENLPVKSVQELVEYIKAKPRSYNFASQGVGTLSHLEGELFKAQYKLDITHVPYKGSVQALPDVVNGLAVMMFDSVTGSMPLVKGNKLKILAVASTERLSLLPDIPTLKQAGAENVLAENRFGLFAPKGVPAEIVKKLADALDRSLKAPQLISAMAAQGAQLKFGDDQELKKIIADEHVFWRKAVTDAGIEPQ